MRPDSKHWSVLKRQAIVQRIAARRILWADAAQQALACGVRCGCRGIRSQVHFWIVSLMGSACSCRRCFQLEPTEACHGPVSITISTMEKSPSFLLPTPQKDKQGPVNKEWGFGSQVFPANALPRLAVGTQHPG